MAITVCLVSLAYLILMVVQIQHLAQFFFTVPAFAYTMAAAIIIGCSFGYGGVFHCWIQGDKRKSQLACVPLICFLFGSYMSVSASEAVFEANNKKREEWQNLGVTGQATRNGVVSASNALQSLQASGVTDPQALAAARQQQQQAIQAHQQQTQSSDEGNDGKNGEEKKGRRGTNPLMMAICLELISHGLGIVLFLLGANKLSRMRQRDIMTPAPELPTAGKPKPKPSPAPKKAANDDIQYLDIKKPSPAKSQRGQVAAKSVASVASLSIKADTKKPDPEPPKPPKKRIINTGASGVKSAKSREPQVVGPYSRIPKKESTVAKGDHTFSVAYDRAKRACINREIKTPSVRSFLPYTKNSQSMAEKITRKLYAENIISRTETNRYCWPEKIAA